MLALILWAALWPPRLPELKTYGCTLVEQKHRWKLLVWVEYENGEGWASWHGNSKNQNSLVQSCDAWLESVDNAAKRRA